MSPEAQNKAIARACGKHPVCGHELADHEWNNWQRQQIGLQLVFRACANCPALHIEGERWPSWDSDKTGPDYRESLDAVREAEKSLSPEQLGVYAGWLVRLVETFSRLPSGWYPHEHYIWHATAAQRREAFLRASNLWVEEPIATPSPQCAV